MTTHPEWQAHASQVYDDAMREASAKFLDKIHRSPHYRRAVLLDPRELHREFFLQFAPQTHLEYAGTFRGTKGSTLEHRSVWGPKLFSPSESFPFEEPNELPAKVAFLLNEFSRELGPARRAKPYDQLQLMAHFFCWFGKLHPFLDGNGHIQRALFAAAAAEIGVPLSNRFAIHPRTYDSLLAWPLEMFTTARQEQGEPYKAMVAEYLSGWLAGPFDAPASGIPSG
ncbi:Fic family protein [Mesorhizobium sp. M1060]|uniref:Fic family protein n=1 Tax=Mesorhizobium sp. M1060 TaxID=2957052 RepID=UPI0033371634